MLDKSRFNRRLHTVGELIYNLFMQIGYYFRYISCEMSYVLDSFPVAVCDNICIASCKILKEKQWHGKQTSIRRYFYEVKIQLLITKDGSEIKGLFLRKLHAVTFKAWLLKITLLIFAFTLNKLTL